MRFNDDNKGEMREMTDHMPQRMSRRAVLRFGLGAAALAAVGTGAGLAIRPVRAGEAKVYTGIVRGVGAGGYDVVAYFTDARAVRGDKGITHSWNGATWRFASAENRDAFAANPARYAPQFGGYCAWAASQGYTAKGDPKHWQVVDGKLYLNFNGRIHRRWQQDIKGNIRKGNANWPDILG